MANIYLQRARSLCALAITTAALLTTAGVAHAELYELQPDMPITIDADSSDFDYERNSLAFRGLRITQGALTVKADFAETDKLDFNDGLWIFTGNVRVEADGSLLTCDRAELTFKANQLHHAILTGAPAYFEQTDPETGQVNKGESKVMTYDLTDSTISMREDARFTDGNNRMSGANITYDLATRRIRVVSDSTGGGVKIMIDPTSPGVTKFTEQDDTNTDSTDPES